MSYPDPDSELSTLEVGFESGPPWTGPPVLLEGSRSMWECFSEEGKGGVEKEERGEAGSENIEERRMKERREGQ